MELDDLLPADQKFFATMINRVARDNLEGLTRIYPSLPGVIEKVLELIPRGASAAVRGIEHPIIGNAIKTAIKSAEIGTIGAINN